MHFCGHRERRKGAEHGGHTPGHVSLYSAQRKATSMRTTPYSGVVLVFNKRGSTKHEKHAYGGVFGR